MAHGFCVRLCVYEVRLAESGGGTEQPGAVKCVKRHVGRFAVVVVYVAVVIVRRAAQSSNFNKSLEIHTQRYMCLISSVRPARRTLYSLDVLQMDRRARRRRGLYTTRALIMSVVCVRARARANA